MLEFGLIEAIFIVSILKFQNLLSEIISNNSERPEAGKTINTSHNFTLIDQLMQHSIYGWMTWLCVLKPSLATIESMEKQGLFDEAYQAAFSNIQNRLKKLGA